MWCLETIIQINKKAIELAANPTGHSIYDECGIATLGNTSKSYCVKSNKLEEPKPIVDEKK